MKRSLWPRHVAHGRVMAEAGHDDTTSSENVMHVVLEFLSTWAPATPNGCPQQQPRPAWFNGPEPGQACLANNHPQADMWGQAGNRTKCVMNFGGSEQPHGGELVQDTLLCPSWRPCVPYACTDDLWLQLHNANPSPLKISNAVCGSASQRNLVY